MVHLSLAQASEFIICTLHEKDDAQMTHFVLRFTHSVTKQLVEVIVSKGSDASPYPNRYNKLPISTSTVFANCPTGEWQYTFWNAKDVSLSDEGVTTYTLGNIVEVGKMYLNPATAGQTFTEYETTTTYKQYAG